MPSMDDFLGIGFALHSDEEYLALTREILEDEVDYFEVNPETLWRLEGDGYVRNDYWTLFRRIQDASGKPFVAHGLAFSLGSGFDEPGEAERARVWLDRIADDHEAFAFEWMSEHLGIIQADGLQSVLPLPLPFTRRAVETVAARLRRLKDVVPEIAFENSANAFLFGAPMDEPAFLDAICEATPCSLVLDLHNVYTQAVNMGFDPFAYVDSLELSRVVQIHVSGGNSTDPEWLDSGRIMRLDSHDGPVPETVWSLLEHVLPRCNNLRGIVVERLNGTFGPADVPSLVEEVRRARSLARSSNPAGSAMPSAEEQAPLPEGEAFGALRRWMVDTFNARDPAAALAAPPTSLSEHERALLDAVDPDGFTVTGLLVRKLRFERLCMGDSRVEAWFDADPQGFVTLFSAYEAAVPPTAYFPAAEADLFHRWRRDHGIPAPA